MAFAPKRTRRSDRRRPRGKLGQTHQIPANPNDTSVSGVLSPAQAARGGAWASSPPLARAGHKLLDLGENAGHHLVDAGSRWMHAVALIELGVGGDALQEERIKQH